MKAKIFLCVLATTLAACKMSSMFSSVKEANTATEAATTTDAPSTTAGCAAFTDLRDLYACIRNKATISEAIEAMPNATVRCTVSGDSAQPGTPTSPRCFLPQNNIMPSWTLAPATPRDTGDRRIEAAQIIPAPSSAVGQGQVMADFDIPAGDHELDFYLTHAEDGGESRHMSCSMSGGCHQEATNRYVKLNLTIESTRQPFIAREQTGTGTSTDVMVLLEPIRIERANGDNDLSHKEIPADELKSCLQRLYGFHGCGTDATPQKCLRIKAMLCTKTVPGTTDCGTTATEGGAALVAATPDVTAIDPCSPQTAPQTGTDTGAATGTDTSVNTGNADG